jgi:hypothetical protein
MTTLDWITITILIAIVLGSVLTDIHERPRYEYLSATLGLDCFIRQRRGAALSLDLLNCPDIIYIGDTLYLTQGVSVIKYDIEKATQLPNGAWCLECKIIPGDR